MGQQKADRNNNMGTLHLLGAFFVLWGHHRVLMDGELIWLWYFLLQTMGVKIIFVISGYLITKSLFSEKYDKKWKNSVAFTLKRVGRIYPEYLFCLLVSTYVIGAFCSTLPLKEYYAHGQLANYMWRNINLSINYGLPGVFESNPYPGAINGSIWTIPVEMALYLLVLLIYLIPFASMTVRKVIYTLLAVGLAALSVIKMLLFPEFSFVFHGTDWIQALDIIPFFLLGGVAALWDLKKFFNTQVAVVLIVFCCAVPIKTPWFAVLMCLIRIVYGVLALILEDKQSLRIWRGIKSEYAYGIYLWGFVVEQVIVSQWGGMLSTKMILILTVVITYAVAAVSYHLVGKPAGRLVNWAVGKIVK